MSTSELTATSSAHDRMSARVEGLPGAESRWQRAVRHGEQARLYTWVFLLVALLVVLIALIAANAREVKLDWVVGSMHASLIWIILATDLFFRGVVIYARFLHGGWKHLQV